MKMSTRIIVVIVKIPATLIPELMLMYVLSAKVTRASATSTILDM